jgi:hypothetical protein
MFRNESKSCLINLHDSRIALQGSTFMPDFQGQMSCGIQDGTAGISNQ